MPVDRKSSAQESARRSRSCHRKLVGTEIESVIANQCRSTGVAIRTPCLSLWERCPAGVERACFTLSVGFAASSPRVGAKGERGRTDCHASVHWLAMTCAIRLCSVYRLRANDSINKKSTGQPSAARPDCRKTMSLRGSAHTAVAIPRIFKHFRS